MEEKYWEQFMVSGRIEDYLHYRNPDVCGQFLRIVNGREDTGNRGKCGESDNGYRNGAFFHSCR